MIFFILLARLLDNVSILYGKIRCLLLLVKSKHCIVALVNNQLLLFCRGLLDQSKRIEVRSLFIYP